MSEFDKQCARILSSGQGYHAKPLVDPRVYAIAEVFVDEELRIAGDYLEGDAELRAKREALVGRAAAAMQQAIEDECKAIRAELEG